MKIVEDKWPTKQLKQTQQQQISINNTTTSATTINSNSNNIITATSKESFPPSLTTSNQSHPIAETTTMSTQMNGIQAENYIPSFQYDNQTAQGQMHHQQMTVHVGNNHNHEMFIPVKQEITSTPNFSRPPQSKFESYVSMSAPVTPSTPRNESPSQTPNTAPPDRKIDNRPAFSSFHSSPYPSQTHRKRRDNTVGFPQDAGPFFTQTQQHYPLYTIDRSTNLKVRINSKVDRGFFLADNDWTCYRRNYFQISSAFSISGTPHHVNESDVSCLIEVDGQYYAVTQFLLGITARVSNSDKKIELVQHTPKRDKGPQMVPGPKPIRPGGNLNLSSVGTNSNIVTFERIQFKTATANNGKRRAAQQYYVLMVDLYAQVETGEPYRLATTTSAPLVVRGRSPGHYADNHERYNPIQMHPAFPNDGRHMSFTGPNGTPGMMPGDFNGPFSSPYGQYPPPFQGFPGSLMMATGPPNSTHAPFHPQHPPQHYMVQNMQETGDNPNTEMFNNGNIHPNNMEEGSNPPTDSLPGGSKPFMKIEIPPQSSHIPDHPLTSPAYHSQEFVEGLHLYNGNHNNGQPANAAATHNGGYHSDSEQHRGNNNNNNNGFNKRQDIISQQSSSNTQQNNSATSNNNNSASTTISSSSPSSTNHSASTPATTTATVNNPSTTTTTTNSELNDEKTNDTNSNNVGNKNPSKIIDENSNNSTTTPTTELGKSLGQMTMDQKSCEQ